ncbi:MAG: sulfite exporter TauE/SafE family protein [Myxococcales bacterium]|nr:sulfite exporter TauE/SafE family protein [Myxococcales bacterium]
MNRLATIATLLLPANAYAATIDPIFKDQLYIVALGLAVALLGVFAGRVFRASYEPTLGERIRRYLGIAVATVGIYVMVGAFTNPLEIRGGTEHWLTDEATCLAQVKAKRRPAVLDFWGRHCKPCIKMWNNTFSKPAVNQKLSGFIKCKFDMDADANQHLWRKYQFSELPAIMFLTSSGALNRDKTLNQYTGPEAFVKHLANVDVAPIKGRKLGDENLVSRWFAQKGFLLTILLIFAAGVGTSLTPCVYPLIPITINVIGASNKGESRLHGFFLSLTYVGGLVLTYSSLGLFAALTGSSIGHFAQNGWVVGGIIALFAAMGLSFLGLFTIELPTSWATKLSQKGGAGFAGAFTIGLVSGFIAAPCVGPVLLSILAWVAQDGNPVRGFGLMFVFALGLGMLFLVIGTFTDLAKRLPSSGPWMENVKTVFALSFFVLALYYLNSIVPPMERLFVALQATNPFA